MRLALEGEVATLVIHRDYKSYWGLQGFSLRLGSEAPTYQVRKLQPTRLMTERKSLLAMPALVITQTGFARSSEIDWGSRGIIHPTMDNIMEKIIEHEMESGTIQYYVGIWARKS